MKKMISMILAVCLGISMIITALISAGAESDDNNLMIVGDMDGDGSVTILDATEIQRYLAKMPANENIGKPVRITDAEPEKPDENKRKPYDGEPWVDKESIEPSSDSSSELVYIYQIYSDCFIAMPVFPFPNEFKINCELSDEWCVGDEVFVTFNNYYYDEDTQRIEGELVSIEPSTIQPDPDVAYKPVIYLYPEEETQVDVKLTLNGEFLCTYPQYNGGWSVTASPDGTLTNKDGKEYNYLYWEGKLNTRYDFSKGFCVKGSDTAAFLEEALAQLGLSRREANEFIVYWLQQMQDNPYNIISFQTEAYTDAATLDISPAPDTLIRVFMAWTPSDEYVEIPEQALTAPSREGFTAVEWGGAKVG